VTLSHHASDRRERPRLGSEARALGHGGVAAVARAAGVSRVTVSAGASELEAVSEPPGRARRPGGGRRRAADADPGLVPALLALVEPEERGDPMSPLRWTIKSTRNLADELTRQGHKVSADTAGNLLRAEGFSLQGNAKTIEGTRHPDRDASSGTSAPGPGPARTPATR
jgi:Rhodopirellula transposase DDE domain